MHSPPTLKLLPGKDLLASAVTFGEEVDQASTQVSDILRNNNSSIAKGNFL